MKIYRNAFIVIILIIVCYLIINFDNDLRIFPFEAAVWGTFSDWAMVIVTSFTAYYLVKSFNSQRENNNIQSQTLKEQQKLTKIEQFIFRERIKPKFELQPFLKSTVYKDDLATYSFSFHFFLTNGTARNINIKAYLFNHETGNEPLFSATNNEKHPGDNIGFMETQYHQNKLNNKHDDAEYIFRFEFFITYADILNNNYETSIMYYHNSNNLINLQYRGIKLLSSDNETPI